MTMAERLEKTGVSLNEDVGYTCESLDHTGTWRVEFAKVARVCVEIPDRVQHFEQAKHYNPEYCIALQWVTAGTLQLCIVTISADIDMYSVPNGGLLMQSNNRRVCIGQTPDFMENVYSILRILGNTHNTLH